MAAKRKKRNASIIVRTMVIALSVYMVITIAGLWGELRELENEYSVLETEKHLKEEDIEELRYILNEGSQTELIEKAARERLGYEYSDAIVYKDISGN